MGTFELEWHQDDCFKHNTINFPRFTRPERHTPSEWLKLFEEEKRQREAVQVGT
jgi:hypothetical protein